MQGLREADRECGEEQRHGEHGPVPVRDQPQRGLRGQIQEHEHARNSHNHNTISSLSCLGLPEVSHCCNNFPQISNFPICPNLDV